MIYKYKFRFNAKHNTSLEYENFHSHTFELVCYIKQNDCDCNIIENEIKEYIKIFKGKNLNLVMLEIPTIENIAHKIYKEINEISKNFILFQLELSDKPIQTYIIGSME